MSKLLPSKQYSEGFNNLRKSISVHSYDVFNTIGALKCFLDNTVEVQDFYLSYVYTINEQFSFGFMFTDKKDRNNPELNLSKVKPFIYKSNNSFKTTPITYLTTDNFSKRLNYLSRKLTVEKHLDPFTTFKQVFSCDISELSDLKDITKVLFSQKESIEKAIKEEENMLVSSINQLEDNIKNADFQAEQFYMSCPEYSEIKTLEEQIRKLEIIKQKLSKSLKDKFTKKQNELKIPELKKQKISLDSKLKQLKSKKKQFSKSSL